MDKSEEQMRKPIRLIAAACRNMGIGKNRQLPWSLPFFEGSGKIETPRSRPSEIRNDTDERKWILVREKYNALKEFQFFLNTVTAVSTPDKKNLVIWGRGSWSSCPAGVLPFANCLNAVLSRTLSAVPKHAHYLCKDFGSVIRLVSEPPLCHIVETIWVLGGPAVYKESLEHPWCDLIYLTDIMADFDCDVFFPKFDRNVFRKQNGFPAVPDEIHEEEGIKFQFQVFKKEA